jgi:hypothetical protein
MFSVPEKNVLARHLLATARNLQRLLVVRKETKAAKRGRARRRDALAHCANLWRRNRRHREFGLSVFFRSLTRGKLVEKIKLFPTTNPSS